MLAGSVLAWATHDSLRADVAILAALSALAIQIGTNLHNDAADTLNQTDDGTRLGPARVSAHGWMTPGQVLAAAHLAFGLAVLCGVWLVVLGGWPILVIGLASVLAGYAYSAGPWPLSRGPFGEVFVILFFGLVAVGGVVWLHAGTVGPPALLLGLIVGLPAAAVLTVNNIRDQEGDTRAGRRTLPILLGRATAVRLHGLLLLGAFGLLGGLVAIEPTARGAALGLLAAPLAWRVWRALTLAHDATTYNAALGRTGAAQVALVLASAVGMVLGRLQG